MKALCLICFCFLLLAWGCKKDEDNNDPAPNNPNPDVASGTVTSNDSAHIVTPEGAYIDVPRGAVPLTADSLTGSMIFSIERVNGETNVVNTPPNLTHVEHTYRFGPEGFVFEEPVEIALPIEGNYQIGQVLLARIDPTTREPQIVSADYDPTTGIIKAQTLEMSDWEVFTDAVENASHAWARILVSGSFDAGAFIYRKRIRICAESFTPRFPEDSTYRSSIFSVQSGGFKLWTAPQGTYTLCLEFRYEDSEDDFNRTYTLPTVTIENPVGWRPAPGVPDFALTIAQAQFDAGTPNSNCSCYLRSTPSPGTGELQVTLTWYNEEPLDLDLWVTDPAGEKCYYGNTHSSSGGVLDRDNLCGNYQNGQPENIFWATAPNGIYTVEVNYYSACADTIPNSQTYAVRVAGAGLTPITETGTIAPNATVQVGQYQLSGGGLRQLPGEPIITYHQPSRGPKIQRN